jgi:hypothetical protein
MGAALNLAKFSDAHAKARVAISSSYVCNGALASMLPD